jgi:hypothetical protein
MEHSNGVVRLEHEQTKGFNGERWELCLAKSLKALKKMDADATGVKRSDSWKPLIAGKKKRETPTAD